MNNLPKPEQPRIAFPASTKTGGSSHLDSQCKLGRVRRPIHAGIKFKGENRCLASSHSRVNSSRCKDNILVVPIVVIAICLKAES